jgi:glycosyltransferase involved in cell wall biosynthesis
MRVAILMCAYNGARHIRQQLDSLLRQDHPDWTLTVSDDGSKDGTIDILEEYRESLGAERLRIVKGPGKGFCRNFLSLTGREEVDADCFAWADQDDVWLPDKLSRAMRLLAPYGQDIPALYCGRTAYVDAQSEPAGLSPLRSAPPPAFENALVQSLAGGNTMVFNRPARELVRAGAAADPVSHDWWAYQIVTGSGGVVIYDHRPAVLYRLHDGNLVGGNTGLAALMRRVKKAWTGSFREMNSRNIEALESLSERLTDGAKATLAAFSGIRRGLGRLSSLKAVRERGLFRRSLFQQISLYLGVFMRRV